jgi:5-methyltetrahydropteroyltriglutamate--homocysteine methyltransferase
MNPEKTIHHADVVGSMLNPPQLIEARGKMRAGEIPYGEYRAIEDAAVDRAIKIQEDAGLAVLTDGEQRRDIYFGWLISGMEEGLEMIPGVRTVKFHGHSPEDDFEVTIPFSVTGKIKPKECPGLDEFRYAQRKTDKQIKVTLPSPTIMMANFWNPKLSADAYPDPFDLGRDVRDAIVGWMKELANAGCTYMQVDAPELIVAYAAADGKRGENFHDGIDYDEFRDFGTELVGSLGDVDLPGVTMALHVCRGNGTRSWIAEGGYEALSKAVFKAASGYDVFMLEYDDERSGDFKPLENLPEDKVAVLGMVSTKWTELENADELKERIEEASRYHPKAMLGISTQCGFASASETAEMRKITEQTQVDKLKLVVDVAKAVWG